MDQRRKEIDIGERKIIVSLWQNSKSYREIAKIVGRQYSSVQRVINNFKQTNCLESKPRSGRPKKLTEREERNITILVKSNPRLTASQISKDIEVKYQKKVHPDTVRKILKRIGFHGRVARKKPFISRVNRLKRMAFAKEYVNKPPEFWNSVIFSDESKFCIFGIKGRKIIWRKNGTALGKQNLVPTVKHGGGGAMIWGCMASSGVGNIQFIESIMNRHDYLDILKTNLRESAIKLGLGERFVFQQDNDPKHTAEIVRLWLLYNVPKQLRTPPQSPDLNPIEHLWDVLEKKIRERTITSKEMLKNALKEEWEAISPEITAKLVGSMKRRLLEVIKRRGYPTSY